MRGIRAVRDGGRWAVLEGGMADEVQWYSVPAVARMLGISERAIRGGNVPGSV